MSNDAPMPGSAERREPNNISTKSVLMSLIALVLCAFLLHLGLAGLSILFKRRAEHAGKSASINRAVPSPTGPALQLAPRNDLAAFREREDRVLNSYGWIDRTTGVVHIPISRAMELLLQRGLPTNTTASKSTYELIKQRSERR
jgi:hypothetical protein